MLPLLYSIYRGFIQYARLWIFQKPYTCAELHCQRVLVFKVTDLDFFIFVYIFRIILSWGTAIRFISFFKGWHNHVGTYSILNKYHAWYFNNQKTIYLILNKCRQWLVGSSYCVMKLETHGIFGSYLQSHNYKVVKHIGSIFWEMFSQRRWVITVGLWDKIMITIFWSCNTCSN